MNVTAEAPVATVNDDRSLLEGAYSQSACNIAGLLNSAELRRVNLGDRCIHGDPVLRLIVEQVMFLSLAGQDAPGYANHQYAAGHLNLTELLIALRDRRADLIASPDWRKVGSPLFERDPMISAYVGMASKRFDIDYAKAYDICREAQRRHEAAQR